MIDLIAFDFDGTIVDTESLAFESFRQLWSNVSLDLTIEEFSNCVGSDNNSFLFDRVTEVSGMSRVQIRDELGRLGKDRWATLKPRDGIVDFIQLSKENARRICIVSSSEESWVRSHLDRFNLTSLFDGFFTKDRVERVKPHPELYLLARSELESRDDDPTSTTSNSSGMNRIAENVSGRMDPGTAYQNTSRKKDRNPSTFANRSANRIAKRIAVEDSANGMRAALAADFHTIVVPNPVTKHLDFSSAHSVYQSFDEIDLAALRRS